MIFDHKQGYREIGPENPRTKRTDYIVQNGYIFLRVPGGEDEMFVSAWWLQPSGEPVHDTTGDVQRKLQENPFDPAWLARTRQ
jgi:hypothetical protein